MKIFIPLIISSFLLVGLLQAQEIILNKIDFNQEINIIDITQYSDGSIWFITENQLFSYDGHKLSLKPNDTAKQERFTKLFYIDHTLFIGTKSGAIMKYSTDSLVKLLKIEGRITDMIKINDIEYLIASNGGGVHKYNIQSNKSEMVNSNSQLTLTNDLQIINNVLFMATDRGLFQSDLGLDSIQMVATVGNKIIKNLGQQGDSILWLSEFKSYIHQLDLKSHNIQTLSLDNNSRIDHLTLTKSKLIASTKQGLFHYELPFTSDSSGIQPVNFINDSSDPINMTYEDDEGNFWIGSSTGLIKSTLRFSKLNIPIQGNIHALLYKKDNLFIGTDQGLYVTDYVHQKSPSRLMRANITCLDTYGQTMAVGTYADGLKIYEINNHNYKISPKQSYSFENSVLAVKFLSANELVVATLSGVKIMSKIENTWGVSEEIKMLDSYYILSIFKSSDNNIWFGTDKKGLLRYNYEYVERFAKTTKGDPIKSVYSLMEDYDGNIWASSNELGLVKQTPKGFSTTNYGLDAMGPYTSITMTRDSLMFLIGVQDIALLNMNNNEFMSYSEELQLMPMESFLNNYCKTDNHVIFEHHGQLYQLNENKEIRTQPITTLIEVQVNLEKIDTIQHEFNELDNNFSFHYNGILMHDPTEVSYTYKLEGFDETWRNTNDRSVTYPHLSPGEYNFIVSSSHELNVEDNQINYKFTILQSFYKRWWFLLTCTLLAVWIGLLWTRKNRREKEIHNQLILQKTETQLSNLKSQLNPHFLFNSFNTVIGLIEEDQARSIEYIQQLTDFFRLVLETGEDELIPIETEIKLLDAYIHLLKERFPSGLDITIKKPFSDSVIPPLSLQLLVENAVKHNVINKLQPLKITIEEELGFMVVENNYNPKKIAEPSTGIGLSNLRSRYELLAKKNIHVNQNEDKMTVKLPIIYSKNHEI